MKKTLLTALIFIVLLSIAAVAQETGEALTIPVPKDATIDMELALTRDQILQQFDSITGAMTMSGQLPDLDFTKIKDALGTLAEVQYAQMQTTVKTDINKTIAFYEEQVKGKRVLYNINPKNGTGLLVLSKPEDGGYFFVNMQPAKDEKGKVIPGARIRAARVVGFPDAAKLAAFIGEAFASNTFNFRMNSKGEN